jgi:Group 4 capsule polysaccharide lipoprotein gfcB, YjbF
MHNLVAWPLLLLLLAGCSLPLPNAMRADLARLAPPAGLFTQEEVGEDSEPEGRALRLTYGGKVRHAALLQELGERRLWRTASGMVVATDGARVVATSGLREVLVATRFDGPDPLAEPAALLDHPAAARRLVDLMRRDREPDGMRFGIAVECRLRARPAREDGGLLLVEERCRAGGEGRFTNRFWADAESGAVLRAEQWIGPSVNVLRVEFPGGAAP